MVAVADYCLSVILHGLVCFLLCGENAQVKCDGSDNKPEYFSIFKKYRHWDGNYMYAGEEYLCYLFINSQHHLDENGLLATFKDTDATFDLEATSPSSSGREVLFTVHEVFSMGIHGKNVSDFHFTLHGFLTESSGVWVYAGNVTTGDPEYGRFVLTAVNPPSPVGLDTPINTAGHYALVIGLPVILGVLGVVSFSAIIYWSIKKGYIRHVPSSYDSFQNPVTFRNNRGNRDTSDVHM